MNELPAEIDLEQAFEYSGYEPFKYSQAEISKLYSCLAKLKIIKNKISNTDHKEPVYFTEAMILGSLCSINEEHIITSTIPNFIADIIRNVPLNITIENFKSYYNNNKLNLNNINYLHFEYKILCQYFINEKIIINSLIDSSIQEKKYFIISELSSDTLINIKDFISTNKDKDSDIILLLINKLGSSLDSEDINKVFNIRDEDEINNSILNTPNILEAYQKTKDLQKKSGIKILVLNQFLYDHNLEMSIKGNRNTNFLDALNLFEKSLITRGLLTKKLLTSIEETIFEKVIDLNNELFIGSENIITIDSIINSNNELYSSLVSFLVNKKNQLEIEISANFLSSCLTILDSLRFEPHLKVKINYLDLNSQNENSLLAFCQAKGYSIFIENSSNINSLFNKKSEGTLFYLYNQSLIVSEPREKIVKQGKDLLLLVWGQSLDNLDNQLINLQDVDIEIINLDFICPFDIDKIADAVKRIGKVMIYSQNKHFDYFAMNLLANISSQYFEFLDAPVRYCSENLEDNILKLVVY